MWNGFSFCHLSEYSLYYFAVPMLLPRRFPVDLPSLRLGSMAHAPPRLLWPLLAAFLYMFGWLVCSLPKSWFAASSELMASSLPVQVLSLYRLKYDHGVSEFALAPLTQITRRNYLEYFGDIKDGVLPHVRMGQHLLQPKMPPPVRGSDMQCWSWPPPRTPVWSLSMAWLDMCGIFYYVVVVMAIAALVPRTRIRFVTTAGAGSMAVYYLQGIATPFFASPLYHILGFLGVSEPYRLPPPRACPPLPPSPPGAS